MDPGFRRDDGVSGNGPGFSALGGVFFGGRVLGGVSLGGVSLGGVVLAAGGR
jgi:hypothetical protein